MAKCPKCGAECDPAEAADGCCHICGAQLAGSGDEFAAHVPESKTRTGSELATPEPDEADQDLEQEPNVDDLIKPRELSGEYARHVTASWLSTPSRFSSPDETINVEPGKTEDESKLVIGPRSVGEADEPDRADYELMEVIGEGNMGTVFSARQSAIDRIVAIKFPKALDDSELARDQFISEVVVSGQLEHPNIVPIYDLAKDNKGQLFYSMKRVEGQPWNECIADKSLEENLEVLMKVCDAIRFAHDRDIVHRDIKPHNIMVGRYGEVSVMDFGIAIRIDQQRKDSRVTKISPAGTPAYMAPEMVAGKIVELTPATDVYLLGAVLFEIITGRPPHPPGATLEEVVLTAARNEIVATDKRGELVDIAKKAMATESIHRYQRVDDFQTAIRGYWSHAESIALVERGEEHLVQASDASQSGAARFDSFDRARFAFQEAIDLWPQNKPAEEGLSRTSLAYARFALDTKNYARGIDLLSPDDPTHRELLGQLIAARRRQDDKDRLRNVLIFAIAAAIVIIAVGGTVMSFWLLQANRRVVAEKKRAEQETIRATNAERQALAAEDEAKTQRDVAVKAREEARTAEGVAKLERDNADKAKEVAEDARDNAKAAEEVAKETSYAFEVGLAAETAQHNAFERADEILLRHIKDPIQAAMRGWEWGRIKYLATKPIEMFGEGHELRHRVESAVISRDGQQIVAGTRNGLIYVWDRENNQQPSEVSYGSTVRSVAISEDGRFIAAAGDARRAENAPYLVKIWQSPVRPNANPVKELETHEQPVLSVAFASLNDELHLLTSSSDETARLWRYADAREMRAFHGHTGAVWSARFSTNRRRIVTAGQDQTVRVWSMESGREVVYPRFTHEAPVYAAEFSPDGRHIVSGGLGRRLLVWELDDNDVTDSEREQQLTATVKDDPPTVVAETDVVLGEHNATVRSISFSEDGKTVASGGHDNTVRVWDFSRRFTQDALVKELRGHSHWVRSCAIYTEGDTQWILSSGYDKRVKMWDWRRYEMAQVLREDPEESLRDDNLVAATYSPDGRWVVTASESGIVCAWDLQNPQKLRKHPLVEGHAGLSTTGIFFARGSRLLTAAGDNTTRVWETATGRQLFQLGTGWYEADGTGWRGIASVSHDGRLIATGSDTGLAAIWDSRTGRRLAQVRPYRDEQYVSVNGRAAKPKPATAIAFSQDDRVLFVGDDNGMGFFFDQLGRQTGEFRTHGSRITAAIFLADGHLITAGADGSVVKWNLTSGQPDDVFRLTHADRVLAMDVSDDGKWIVTSSSAETDEGMVHLWDIEAQPPVEQKRLLPWTSARADQANAAEVTQDAPKSGSDKPRFPVVRSIDLHSSGKHALLTVFNPSNSKYRIGRWDWSKREPTYEEIPREMPDVSMASYTDKDQILTVGGKGAQLWDAQLTKVTMSFRLQRQVNFASFSHDGQFIVCAGADGSLTGTAKTWRWDAPSESWNPDAKLPSESRKFNSAVFHPQRNDVILTASEAGKAEIWKRSANGTWAFLMSVFATEDGQAMHQAIFSPDGTRVLTMSADARLWNYDGDRGTATMISRPLPHAEPVLCGAFSRNGQWIVTGSGNQASIWQADWDRGLIQQVDTELGRHSQPVNAVAFSREKQVPKRLLTASQDFTVKLWDTSDLSEPTKLARNELLTLEEHQGEVTSVEFSPDGLKVLTAARDGQAIIRPSDPFENPEQGD